MDTDADADAGADGDGATPAVTPAALQDRIDADDPVRVLDLRDRDEVDQWHISGPSVTLTQIPNNRFIQATVTDSVDEFVDGVDGEGPITVVCARGEASDVVAEGLRDAGYDAHNLAGGLEAWARLYRATEIAPDQKNGEENSPTVVQYRRPSSGCLGYLVVAGDEAAVVDPLRAFADRYVDDAADYGAEIRWVVDTHVHADHVSGLRALAAATGATPVMSETAVERGVTFDVETVRDGETLEVGSTAMAAVHLPGHTTGMFGFAVGNVFLSGDSLFLDGVARPDLQDGPDPADLARELYASLTDRLARLADETLLAPGHYDSATQPAEVGSYTAPLGEVRERLPVFSESAEAFVERVTATEPPQPASADRIVAINLGEETVGEDDAFELELGPNNCAAGD